MTTVVVSNDAGGRIDFRITLPNRHELVDLDTVVVALDTDKSVRTGCDLGASFGVDWSVSFFGHTDPTPDAFSFARWSRDCHIDSDTPQGSLAAAFEPSTTTLDVSFHCADIGSTGSFRFLIDVYTDPRTPGDIAPDANPWTYVVDSASCMGNLDRTPPSIKAIPSTGKHGRTARLRYTVFDDAGKAREEITIRKRGRTLLTKRTRLGSRSLTKVYLVNWRVPATVVGDLRFCVRAWDAVGNRSAPSCARLTIR